MSSLNAQSFEKIDIIRNRPLSVYPSVCLSEQDRAKKRSCAAEVKNANVLVPL